MVGAGGEAFAFEEGGEGFGGFLAGAVDDGGGGGVFAEAIEESGPFVLFQRGGDTKGEVGAVEGELDLVGCGDVEVAADVVGDFGGGGGGEGEDTGDAEVFGEAGQLEVVGAEVVAPLGDAVGFVDGEEGDGHLVEAGAELLVGEALGGDVEEFEGAGADLVIDGEGFLGAEGGVEAGGGDASLLKGIDLVLHEGDEGGDDEGDAVEEEGGKLVAEGLAAAGGKDGEGGAVGEEGLDDRLLAVAELGVAEVVLESGLKGGVDGWRMAD